MVINITISANTASDSGGGIYNSSGTLTVTNIYPFRQRG